MKAKVQRIAIPEGKRTVCISDVHGNLGLLTRLLEKVAYCLDDFLILLGDLYLKGKQGPETLAFIMALSQNPGVHALRGNCDFVAERHSAKEAAWLEGLPHIIASDAYVFVHAGITPAPLEEQDAASCVRQDAFMEQGHAFDRYVIAGHWPTVNYTREIPCMNPIVNEQSRIAAIDGGNCVKPGGQLNALIIRDGAFSFDSVDDLPVARVKAAQAASGGLNITWLDRFIEPVREGEEWSLYRHITTGKTIALPTQSVWTDADGNLCAGGYATDYHLPVEAGETVSLVARFGDRVFAKKNGVAGWVRAECLGS